MEIQYAFLFFISGAILTIFYSRLVGLYHGIRLFQKLEEYTLVYLLVNKKMVQAFLEDRRNLASSYGASAEDIASMKKTDIMLMDVFKKSVLVINKKHYPSRYLGQIKYRTWEELERYAQEVTKRAESAK